MLDFLRSFYKNPALNKKELLSAIERTSQNLQTILNDPSIKLVLIDSYRKKTIKDYKKQWKGKSSYLWTFHLKRFSPFKKKIGVALYSSDRLNGLCNFTLTGGKSGKVEISLIEGNPNPHNLKGYVVGAFSECAINIAKELHFNTFSVYLPLTQTRKACEKLGFDNAFGIGSIFMKVSEKTKLNWENLVKHQKSKQELSRQPC